MKNLKQFTWGICVATLASILALTLPTDLGTQYLLMLNIALTTSLSLIILYNDKQTA